MLCSSFAIDLPYRTAPFAPEPWRGPALRLQPEGRVVFIEVFAEVERSKDELLQ